MLITQTTHAWLLEALTTKWIKAYPIKIASTSLHFCKGPRQDATLVESRMDCLDLNDTTYENWSW